MRYFAYPVSENGYLDDKVDWQDLGLFGSGDTKEDAIASVSPDLPVDSYPAILVLDSSDYSWSIEERDGLW